MSVALSRNVLTGIAVCCVAVFSVGCTQARYRSNIERVLLEDSTTGENSEGYEASQYYEVVVDRMSEISLRGCPDDFVDAYEEHIEAWDDARKYVASMDSRDGSAISRAFRAGVESRSILRGLAELLDSGSEEQRKVEALSEEIRSTFRHALRVAKRYDVDTSSYR